MCLAEVIILITVLPVMIFELFNIYLDSWVSIGDHTHLISTKLH